MIIIDDRKGLREIVDYKIFQTILNQKQIIDVDIFNNQQDGIWFRRNIEVSQFDKLLIEYRINIIFIYKYKDGIMIQCVDEYPFYTKLILIFFKND